MIDYYFYFNTIINGFCIGLGSSLGGFVIYLGLINRIKELENKKVVSE